MASNNHTIPRQKASTYYKKSLLLISGSLTAGVILQVLTGSFDLGWLKFPVNLGIGICLLFIPLLSKGKNKFLSGLSLSVTLLTAFAVLTLIMGLCPPEIIPEQYVLLRSFFPITRCWPFILLYFLLLIHLAFVTTCKIHPFTYRKTAFLSIHAGLWVLLFAAGPGSADKERYKMQIQEGNTQNLGINEKGQWIILPFNIRLTDFKMEEYPPKIAVYDQFLQQLRPVSRPTLLDAGDSTATLKTDDWTIKAYSLLPEAEKNNDSSFIKTTAPFSVPAVRITATHKNGIKKSGWISSGNHYRKPQELPLNGTLAVIMLPPEPRLFISELQIIDRKGKEKKGTTGVNHPLTWGSWKIYQSGYNFQLGKDSDYSILELVYDPWLIPAYIGIILLMTGCISLFWLGSKQNKTKNNYQTVKTTGS